MITTTMATRDALLHVLGWLAVTAASALLAAAILTPAIGLPDFVVLSGCL